MDHPPVLPPRKQVPLLPRLFVLRPAQHRIFLQQRAPCLHTCTHAEICPEPTGLHSLLALMPLLCCHLGQRALRPARAGGLTSLSLRFSHLKYGEGVDTEGWERLSRVLSFLMADSTHRW